jgi:hypothetical protein
MPGKVECRSDHSYLGYPVAFYWQDRRLEIVEVVSELRYPDGYEFRVRTGEREIFVLNYVINTDQWSVQQL